MKQTGGFLFLPHLAFFLSGIAGLGYQIVWTRGFALGLGHEMPSLLAILGAIFFGFALGSWLGDGSISRSKHPGRWFVAIELAAAAWSLLTILLIPWANTLLGNILGPAPLPLYHWLVSFGLPLLILLPCTMAMGATLPIIDRYVSSLGRNRRTVSGLYAVNTAGAAVGILLSIHFFLPQLGFRTSIFALASCDFMAALIILATSIGKSSIASTNQSGAAPTTQSSYPILRALFLTGLLGIGYEVLCIRALIQVFQNTIYTYGSALFVYLLGTALGAAAYQRFAPSHLRFRPVLTVLVLGLALSCGLGLALLTWIEEAYEFLVGILGTDITGSVLSEMLVSSLVFFLPTFLMGACFGHLAGKAKADGVGVGKAFAINTLGGACASPLFGVILLPLIGVKAALLLVALLYLPLWAVRRTAWGGALAAVALIPLVALPLRLVKADPDETIVSYEEGIVATVATLEKPNGTRRLKVNNLFVMGGSSRSFIEPRMAAIPVLLHPAPSKALFLGLGPGVTFGTMQNFPSIESDGVELIPEVVHALPYFSPTQESPDALPGLTVHTADARRFVRTATEHYDIIVGDLFQPARDGAGALYTVEHFQAVKERLQKPSGTAGGGIFCQWIPFYQIDSETLRLISNSFLEVFPEAYLLLASYNINTPVLGLIGGHEEVPFQAHFESEHIRTGKSFLLTNSLLLRNEFEFAGTFLMSNRELRQFVGDSPLNRDDLPLVTWRAPKLSYGTALDETDGTPARFFALAEEIWDLEPMSLSRFGKDFKTEEKQDELGSFFYARDLYLSGLFTEQLSADGSSVDFFLQSLIAYPEFNPSRARLRSIANQYRSEDPDFAKEITDFLRKIERESLSK